MAKRVTNKIIVFLFMVITPCSSSARILACCRRPDRLLSADLTWLQVTQEGANLEQHTPARTGKRPAQPVHFRLIQPLPPV